MLRFSYVLQGAIGLIIGSALQTEAFRCAGWTVRHTWALNIVVGGLYLAGGVVLGRAFDEEKRRPSN